jgi:uncharacterized protein YutE (UPF0331/DUF86 family)
MTERERQVLEQRLARLAELLVLLRRDRGLVAMLGQDVDLRDRVERRLQLSAQIAIDVAHYLIARFRWPRSEKESLWDVLAREQVIAAPLAERLSGLAGFRNVLVHEYLGIDLDVVAEAVRREVESLAELRAAVLAFLETTG